MTKRDKPGDQLAYALITPYSLHKGRTGGIIARLLWADVHVSAVRMYAPGADGGFIAEYCNAIYDPREKEIPLRYQRLLVQYVMENLGRPNIRGISNRMMVIVFRGPNAQEDIRNAVGHIGRRGGETPEYDVRGTFGDYVIGCRDTAAEAAAKERTSRALAAYPALQQVDLPEQSSFFFEPAVLTGAFPAMTEAHLKLFRDRAYTDGGFVLSALDDEVKANLETSMVILKPESFSRRNPLPGNLIDVFSRLGMYITGAKMVQLSVEQARLFYAAKLPQFRSQLKGMVTEKAREIVGRARELRREVAGVCGFPAGEVPAAKALRLARAAEYLYARPQESEPGKVKKNVVDQIYSFLLEHLEDLDPAETFYEDIAEKLKDVNALAEFNELIRYMSGADPETGEPVDAAEDASCMALLYSGPDSLHAIRTRLKELRDVYGQNILHNRAHASDPDEDPVQETRVLGMPNSPAGEERPCDIERVVSEFYG